VAAAAVLDRGGGAGWGRRCWTEPEVLAGGGPAEVLDEAGGAAAGGGGVAGNRR
jgi:hypothetical protein